MVSRYMSQQDKKPNVSIPRLGLREDEIEEIREAFNLFDTDCNGTIDPGELKIAMQSLGMEAKNQAIYQMINDIDQDRKGNIAFEEFLEIMTSRISYSDSEEDIKKVFNLFDDDKTGYITIQNLKRVSRDLGENTMSDADLLEMIDRADVDQDGQISIHEFHTIMTTKTFA